MLRVQMILTVTARKSKDFSHGRGDRFHDVRVLSSLVFRVGRYKIIDINYIYKMANLNYIL